MRREVRRIRGGELLFAGRLHSEKANMLFAAHESAAGIAALAALQCVQPNCPLNRQPERVTHLRNTARENWARTVHTHIQDTCTFHHSHGARWTLCQR
jgi:hypothetical protein